jgi:murein DD-endopeptidase MepM/ murein hydrolase activator NlpD
VPALIAANKLEPPYTLTAGQRLVLPREDTHRVTKGEDLFTIAAARGIDPYLLAAENGLTRPFAVREGQILRLPAKAGPQPATAPKSPAERDVPDTEVAGLPQAPSAAKPQPAADESFIWPVQGRVISAFGAKGDGLHNDGINIAARAGTPVRAVAAGTVAYAGNELRGFGNLVLIKHADGWVSAYAHNEALLVNRGEKVRQGQVIARVGSTGGVGEAQLHFELRRGKTAVDPAKYLKPART